MQPRIPLSFQLHFSRNSLPECTAQYCSDMSPHSHYQSTDINPLFHSIKLKPISTWSLAFETAMLQIYSNVYQNALEK